MIDYWPILNALMALNRRIARQGNGLEVAAILARFLAEEGVMPHSLMYGTRAHLQTTGVYLPDGRSIAITELWRTWALEVDSAYEYAGHWRFIYGPSGDIKSVFHDGRRDDDPPDITAVVHVALPHLVSIAS